jgi:hypothetical protein
MGNAIVGFISLGLAVFFGAWIILLLMGGSLLSQSVDQTIDRKIEAVDKTEDVQPNNIQANNEKIMELGGPKKYLNDPDVTITGPEWQTGCYEIHVTAEWTEICPTRG